MPTDHPAPAPTAAELEKLFDAYGEACANEVHAGECGELSEVTDAKREQDRIRAKFRAALAAAEQARGAVRPAPELADKLSQMAAAIGAWDDDPIMLTDFLCEIGARALLWEAMARITETATLTERLARAEADAARYRFTRDHVVDFGPKRGEDDTMFIDTDYGERWTAATIDEAVDEALRAAAGGKAE